MKRFGQVVNVVGLLNSFFVVTMGMLYTTGGQITKDEVAGWLLIITGAFFILSFFFLMYRRLRENRRQLKEMIASGVKQNEHSKA